MIILRKNKNAPSLNAIGESLARAFNTYNKKINEKDQFEFGEAVSVDAKTLEYHVEEKIQLRFFATCCVNWIAKPF